MKAIHSILIWAALIGAASALFSRKFIHVKEGKYWTDAQAYCRNNYVDLMTIFLPQDYLNFHEIAKNYYMMSKHWTGLTLDSEGTVEWSDGSPLRYVFWGSTMNYQNTQRCLALYTYHASYIGEDLKYHWQYTWQFDDCTSQLWFFCYKWEPQPIVVLEMKTWVEALDYCRSNHTDLISLPYDVDLFVVNNGSLGIQTSRFWTGLRFLDGSWLFSNNKDLGNVRRLRSLPRCPLWPFHCGARITDVNGWEYKDCNEKMNFICY